MPAFSTQILSLGTSAPNFTLINTIDGEIVSLNDFKGKKGLLVMFICNHCPYVIRIRNSFRVFTEEYLEKDIAIVAINANSTKTHPQDGPEEMKKLAMELNWKFPYLFDESQDIAKAYKAACTPDFFLFDKEQKLVYRGQYDDARPRNKEPVTGKNLKQALNALLKGNPVQDNQIPSAGCSIKWHPGSFPEYEIITK